MASQDKINVLFIIKPERAAGAEMVLLEAAARLNRERFRVFAGLLTPDRENLLPPHLTPIDFNLPGLNGWVWLRFFLHLCWVLRRYRIQLIHTNSYVPGNYARPAAALMRVPVIVDHWHGFTRFSRKRKIICRLLGRITDLSLAVSQGVRDYLLEQVALDPARRSGWCPTGWMWLASGSTGLGPRSGENLDLPKRPQWWAWWPGWTIGARDTGNFSPP